MGKKDNMYTSSQSNERKMIKMKKVVICLIICFSLSITACGCNKNAGAGNGTGEIHHNAVLSIIQHYDGIFPIGIEENVIFQIRADLDKDIEKRLQMQYEDEVSHDYGRYLNKIWIPVEWSGTNVGAVDTDLISFCITNIENGVIEGKIATDYIADPSHKLRSFFGTIKNGLGECKFVDKAGNQRSFQLILTNEELITVELQYMKDGKLLSEKVDYKPYNLSDIAAPVTINTRVEADLNLWGSVQIEGGRYDTTRAHYGVVYLVDENEDIFYELGASFRTGAEIVEVSTEDINEDGLTDIKVIERFEADDIDDAEWIFLQREDGYFEEGHFERWITKNP